MTAVDISSRAASTLIGIESTFGSVPSMTRCFPETGSTIELVQDNLPNLDERERIKKGLAPIQGNKSWSAKLTCAMRVDGTQLTAAGTAATPWLGILLKAGLGGETSCIGTTVASATTAASFTLTSSTGFKVGQWIAVDIDGTLEPTRITSITGDVVTCKPSLSGTPDAAAVVVASYTYFPTETNTQSLYLQHAKAQDASGHKYGLGGGLVGLAISAAMGGKAMLEASLKGKAWAFPTSDSPSVAAATDGMATPMPVRNAVTLIQTPATTTKVHYPFHGVEVTQPGDMGLVHVPELGGVEGATGVMRVGERPFGRVKLKLRADTQLQTWYEAQTLLSIVVILPSGSGLTKRFIVGDFPNCVIVAVPKPMDEGGRQVQEVELECLEDTTTTTSGLTGAALDCALATERWALI